MVIVHYNSKHNLSAVRIVAATKRTSESSSVQFNIIVEITPTNPVENATYYYYSALTKRWNEVKYTIVTGIINKYDTCYILNDDDIFQLNTINNRDSYNKNLPFPFL